MGDVQGPKQVNNTCVKTMHVGMMDRGFIAVLKNPFNKGYSESSTNHKQIPCQQIRKVYRFFSNNIYQLQGYIV
jgi:hypothetical protein